MANLTHISVKWGGFEMTAAAGTVDDNRHFKIPQLHSALSQSAGNLCIHDKSKMVLTAQCPTNEYVAVFGRLRNPQAPTQHITQDVVMTKYQPNGASEFKKL
jgi:hypothetical protein